MTTSTRPRRRKATPEEVRADLTSAIQANRIALEEAEARRTRLYAERLDLYRKARDLSPPITQRELAELAGVSEPAVIQTLRKAGLRGPASRSAAH